MQIDWRVRLALVIGGVVLVGVALAGAAWGALDEGIVQSVVTVIGGLLTGIGLAGGPSRGAGVAVLILAVLPLTSGCGAACQTERTLVDLAGGGIDAAASALDWEPSGDGLGDDPSDLDVAMTAARATAALGSTLVDACENLRDEAGWQEWLVDMLAGAAGVASIFTGAADGDVPDEVPGELLEAIDALEAAQ